MLVGALQIETVGGGDGDGSFFVVGDCVSVSGKRAIGRFKVVISVILCWIRMEGRCVVV